MTGREMQIAFVTFFESKGVEIKPLSDDIFRYINDSQWNFVLSRYNGLNLGRRGFEESQERIDDLRVLVKKDTEIAAEFGGLTSGVRGYLVDSITFPEDYMLLLSHRVAVHYVGKGSTFDYKIEAGKREPNDGFVNFRTKTVLARLSQQDDIYRLLDDPFNTTLAKDPIADISGQKLNVYTDESFIVDKAFINYIKTPVSIAIDQDCELPEHTHKEIVDGAIQLYLAGNARTPAEQKASVTT